MDNTSPVSIEISNNEPNGRTSPIYVQEKGKLSLNDILSEKPADFNGQIDISWLQQALDQKAAEIKYAPWDAIYMPADLWVASAYGNNTIIAAAASGKICISSDYGAVWHEKQISDNLCAAAFGSGNFILYNNSGKCFISADNGLSWQESFIAVDNITCAAYFNDKFIAGSSSGNIYISEDNGINWKILYQDNNTQIIKMIYSSSNILMVICNNKSLYSIDNGITFNEISMPESSFCSLTYGKGKFIACAYDGDVKMCFCLDKDILGNNPLWQNITLSCDEPWKDICFGADVFTLASSTGVTLASKDGFRWIKTPCPDGSWNNILRTDYFFMIFSLSENNDNLNAIRSSNGGLAGIMFATLNEVISDEYTDKAINPQTLKDYLAYRTGKNNLQYPVYSDNLLIECTSTDTRQIKITNINAESQIDDYNQINISGIYIIEKSLQNAPLTENGFLLVQQSGNIMYQFFSLDNLFNTGYMRTYNNNMWGSWQKILIKQNQIESIDLSENNMTISETTDYNSLSHIIAEENGIIKKFDKNQLNETINNSINDSFNNMAGNHIYYQNTRNYQLGTLVLGSDNALYYCIAANGTSNIKDPVSSPNYWLKIINSNGTINTDNLSKTLGSFALLNSIALTNSAVTGILPVNKGGTGNTLGVVGNIQGNSIRPNSIEFYPSSTSYYGGYIDFHYPSNPSTDFTSKIMESMEGRLDVVAPKGLHLNGVRLYTVPTKASKIQPSNASGTAYNVGDKVYRYSFGNSAVTQYAPSGGSWLLETFVTSISNGSLQIDLCSPALIAGGSKLDTNSSFNFLYILTKIS